jgi:NADH-quinone oxidoreductase subunit M
MVPLIVMIFVMGIYPKPFIDKMDPAVKKLVAQVRPASISAKQMPPAVPAMPACQPGMEMPAGHGAQPAADPHAAPAAAPAVNPHEGK